MSLVYIVKQSAKNRLLSLKKKPGLLVLYLFFAALIGISFYSTLSGHIPIAQEDLLDIGWLKLAFFAYLLLIAVTSIATGLSSGNSVFHMADANFLFGAPISPKKILAYGIVQQMVKSIFASIFILMLGQTLRSLWGIGLSGLFLLFGAYVISLVLMQLVSICIYMYASGRKHFNKLIIAVCLAFFIPLLVSIATSYAGGTPISEAALQAIGGHGILFVPVIGWITEVVMAILLSQPQAILLPAILIVAFVIFLILLITVGKTDYYEDVLVATEKLHMKQQAMKDGDLNSVYGGKQVRSIRQDDQIKGTGARAFLGKHMLENARQNRLKVLDKISLIFIGVSVFMAFFMREGGSVSLITVMSTMMGMRLFLIGTSSGLRELYQPYIFMIPASSFSKLVWSNLETAIKNAAEHIIAIVIAGIIVKASVPAIIACILCSTLFSILLISVNVLSMRLFANVISQGILLTLYIFFVMLVIAPGIGLAAVFGGLFGVAAGLLILTVWELLLSALFFFLSRGVLDTCDMETMPQFPQK